MPSPVASRQTRIMAEQLMSGNPPLKLITAAATLTVADRVVDVSTTSAAYNLTLPSVAECDGMSFMIKMSARGSTFNVTVKDAADSLGWADLVMDTVGDNLILYSDGLVWHPTKIGVT